MHLRLTRSIVSTAALGLSMAFVLPLAAAHAQAVRSTITPNTTTSGPQVSSSIAQHGWNLVPGSASSLTLSPGYRNTHVHLMPTLQWYEQHSAGAGSAASLGASTCVLGSDASTGDAVWETQQNNAADITAFGLSTSADGKTLTAQIKVQNLSDGPGGTPALSGDGDNWYVTWDFGKVTGINGYFLTASYPGGSGNVDSDSGLPVDFSWGEIQPGTGTAATYAPIGTVTGSLDLKSNTITISAPISDFSSTTASGGPPAFDIGDQLTNVDAESWAQAGAPGVGGLIQPVDKVQTQVGNYVVGDSYPNCPGAASTGSGGPGTSGVVPTQGSTKNLAYYGGPVVHSIHNYVIFWLPQAGTTSTGAGTCTEPAAATFNYEPSTPTNTYGPGSDTSYETILQNYFKDLQGTSFYNLLGQYSDRSSGVTNNIESFGGAWTDPCGYTSTANPTVGAAPGGTTANPVYDLDLQNEVLKAIKANHWPEGLGNQYFVYLGFGVATCFNPNTNSPTANACDISGAPPAFCAYHGDFTDPNNGNTVLYANMTDGGLQTAFACYSSPIGGSTSPAHTVNGAQVHDFVADAEVSITSHEQYETDTDPMVGTAATTAPPLGWYDTAAGEIGDKCAYIYGSVGTDGANITLQNGDRYIVQQEWSNWANGCALADPTTGPPTYGGASSGVPINPGWNLISLPVSGIGDSDTLAGSMQGSGQLSNGSVSAVAAFHGGLWNVAVPGYTSNIPLQPSDGVFVLSNSKGAWTPSGALYSGTSTLNFGTGWNLVSAAWPNPGVMTDSLFNQVEAENHACHADSFTNG
ncbi:MAG TPA: hypothetical protein VG815_08175, partial [Chloroflexota bacterium]|nr:hypothetical protein [Chloroflexota bacterium]